jgi:hypothetical protein
MTSSIIVGVYLLGIIVSMRQTVWHFAQAEAVDPRIPDWEAGWVLSFIAGVVWPVWTPIYFLKRLGLLAWIGHTFPAVPRSEQLRHKELELQAREARVADLEQSLGIGTSFEDVA